MASYKTGAHLVVGDLIVWGAARDQTARVLMIDRDVDGRTYTTIGYQNSDGFPEQDVTMFYSDDSVALP
jgi:hypothetical protein